jgi:hypothetical protein
VRSVPQAGVREQECTAAESRCVNFASRGQPCSAAHRAHRGRRDTLVVDVSLHSVKAAPARLSLLLSIDTVHQLGAPQQLSCTPRTVPRLIALPAPAPPGI